MDAIYDQFASIFEKRLFDYKNARNSNRISRVEYLVLFVHLVVGTEIITAEPKLKDNKEFTYIGVWDIPFICDYLKKSVKDTSLCGQEYVFLENMINVEKSKNFLEDYRKLYVDTKVEKCMLASLFQKLFDRSKNLEIIG